jgi:5'-nucleotidase
VNNLWTVDLTGAQFKQVLEEQWQPAGSSRPFLHLGLSSNVSVTLDADAPTGQHVTSVLVNGQPLDLARTYRVGTFSFLATGGDNFTTFLDGTNVKDTGMIDRDAWIDYLGANSPVSPRFDRREVYASNLPASIGPGDQVSFTLHRLDLTSLGSPANGTVDVTMHTAGGDQAVASGIAVSGGEATVAFTAPASVPAGAAFVVTANPSGTTVTIPAEGVTVQKAATRVHLKAPNTVRKKHRWTLGVTVTSAAGTPGGKVDVYLGNKLLRTVRLSHGKVSVRMPAYKKKGKHTVQVRYRGNGSYLPSSKRVTVRVR